MWTAWFVHERNRGHDLAGSAVTALVTITGHKSGLHRMKTTRLAKPFDGCDLVPLMHHRKRETRVYPASIDMDRTGAALPVVASLFGPGYPNVFSEAIEQRSSGIKLEMMFSAIDPQRDRYTGRRRS